MEKILAWKMLRRSREEAAEMHLFNYFMAANGYTMAENGYTMSKNGCGWLWYEITTI